MPDQAVAPNPPDIDTSPNRVPKDPKGLSVLSGVLNPFGGMSRAYHYGQEIGARQKKASDLIEARNGLLTKLPSLLGPSGEETDDYKKAYQALTQANADLAQMYHPNNDPSALKQDWHFLLEKMHNIKQPKDKTPSSVTTQTPAVTLNAPAAPITTPELPADAATGQAAVPSTTTPGMVAQPLMVTQSFSGKSSPGMVAQGNLDLSNRPNIDNGDGTHSSTFSMSFGTDKGEVLVPGVGDGKTYPARQLRVLYTLPDGSQKWAVPGNQPHNWIAPERPTPQNNEALNQYQKTGKNFGTFEDEKSADAYGKTLHEDQEKYGNNGVNAHPVSKSGNITIPAGPKTTITKAPTPSWGQAQVLKQKAEAMQRAYRDTDLSIAAAPLSPVQQATVEARAAAAKQEAEINSALAIAKKLGIDITPEEIKQKMGLKSFALKPIPGAAGQPVQQPDGSYARPMYTSDNATVWQPMPAGWKPNIKAVRGTVIKSKDGKWYQTWVNPYDTSKIIGVQPFTPGRQYTGSTSSSSSTDPFGLTTSTSRSTTPNNQPAVDMDITGIPVLSENFTGEEDINSPAAQGQTPPSAPSGSPNKSVAPTVAHPASVAKPTTGGTPKVHPKPTATPAQLRSQIPAPPQASKTTLPLDATGHIPANAPYNASLIGAANQLIDGMDIAKLTIPQKAKEAASNLARTYGWGGQGMFTPREALQLKEGASFLSMMANSPTLKVLDNGFFSNIPMTGSSSDPAKEGFFGKLLTNAAARNQTPEQQKFMDLYRQLDAMAIGLRALVQTGRGTQKQTDLLISELPNPYNTPNSEDAKRRLALVQKELEIASKTGHLPEFEEMQKDFNSSAQDGDNPHQHKVGDFVMLGDKKVKIKKLNPDGTFEY